MSCPLKLTELLRLCAKRIYLTTLMSPALVPNEDEGNNYKLKEGSQVHNYNKTCNKSYNKT